MKSTRRPQKRAARRRTNRTRTQTRNRVLLTQTSRNDHLSMFLAGLVVVILMIAVSVNGMSLNRRLGENRKRAVQLKKEIQKLGLIYEGETVFKEDK